MWKIIVGFIAFAALAMFVISKGGDSLDMGGEKHGTETTEAHGAASAASAAAPAASAASAATSAASAPASK
jgi:hypothetical protein